jgi:hypothetical protein
MGGRHYRAAEDGENALAKNGTASAIAGKGTVSACS